MILLSYVNVGGPCRIVCCVAHSAPSSRPYRDPHPRPEAQPHREGGNARAELPDALAPIASAIEARADTAWWREGRRAAQWAIDWRDPDDLALVGEAPRTHSHGALAA
ncbi:hypothetical protein GCM10022202_20050 [Microbacterium marinilacus]|uniref:Uncharacterized protein n=1 Tax=Microbacterium marinilacus TaxID=415209 RepID=A0ABP7BGN5_9MICO